MSVTDLELGWITGTLDGEGAIGLAKNNRDATITPRVQMSTTCEVTAERVIDLFGALGARGRGYSYQEKKPERHLPSFNVHVSRLADVKLLAEIIGPHSVTKSRQWEVVREFCELRLDGAVMLASGIMRRPGGVTGKRTYGEREWELYELCRELNRRGPR